MEPEMSGLSREICFPTRIVFRLVLFRLCDGFNLHETLLKRM